VPKGSVAKACIAPFGLRPAGRVTLNGVAALDSRSRGDAENRAGRAGQLSVDLTITGTLSFPSMS
jgi:ABC-type uncharacterized transport system YnjBCD substrate-binding protein